MPREQVYTRPEELTVAKLKRELTEEGVKIPLKPLKKADYVRLYKENILEKKPSASFSSDEESFVQTARATRQRTKARKSEVRVTLEKVDVERTSAGGAMDVQNLTDEQLRQELERNGFSVGPIGPTTRKLYEKKLEKGLKNGGSGGGDAAKQKVERYSDDEESEESDVEVVEPVPMETRRKPRTLLQPTITKSGSATRRRPMRRGFEEQDDDAAEVTMTQQKTEKVVEEKGEPVPRAKQEPLKSKRSWVPIWVQIVIVLLLFALIYFVIQAMEENPVKRIPST